MAITGRVRIDLTHIPTVAGLPALGHDREATTWLWVALDSGLAPNTPFTIRVGNLVPALAFMQRDLWAAFARAFDSILIEGDDAMNVSEWVAALRALAIEGGDAR